MAELTGYWQSNLSQMLDTLGEETVSGLLSSFSCPQNHDVEHFLRCRAIEFVKQGITATHLVWTSYQGEPVLIGYYALTTKVFTIRKTAKLSSRLKARVRRFAKYNPDLRQYELPVPLIAQLGKNYANNYATLITGDELLQMAFDRIRVIQLCMGGKFAYLECADVPSLVRFYERNGFVHLDTRYLSKNEIGLDGHEYYLQMIKYF